MDQTKEPDNKNKNHLQDGDIVECSKIKSPTMVVKELCRQKDSVHPERTIFIGVKCYWFTDAGIYQEAVFHALDLAKKEKND